jgi:hypothetical protein
MNTRVDRLLFTNADLARAAGRQPWLAVPRMVTLKAEGDGEQSVVVLRAPRDGELTVEQFWLRCLEHLHYIGVVPADGGTRFTDDDALPWKELSEEAAVARLADPFGVTEAGEGWRRGKVDSLSVKLDGAFIGAQRAGWPDDDDLETWIVVATDREFVAFIWQCSA